MSEFENYRSTLKETSFDLTNNEFLCEDESVDNVFDFDAYVKAKFGNVDALPASPDAICLGSKHLYFVEFKNQEWSRVNKPQIVRKFRDGTQFLKTLLSKFSPRDNKFYFCVVYKKDTSTRAYHRNIQASQERYSFDAINEELGGFYDEIFVHDIDFYKQNFSQLVC
ncbi:hypothetical protein [Oligella urethralis]|uniref:hypothetical protein n=1 Tax=Oligella urethralis TaxID=90245 RepID=UPI0027B88753|nr:hypothetical protein [Oligella urethralis]